MKTYETTMLSEQHPGGTTLDDEIKRGIAASEAGDKAAAEAIFRQIVARQPDALEAWVWLGWTSASLDDSEAAFTRASALDPSNEEAQLGMRWVASQRSSEPQAYVEPQPEAVPSTSPFHQATTLPTVQLQDDWEPEDAMRRAVAAAQVGGKPDAYALFRQIAERCPDSPEVWVWCGGTSPNLDDAEAAFRRAQHLDPNNEEANLGLRWVALRRQAARQTAGRFATNPNMANTGPLYYPASVTAPISQHHEPVQGEQAPMPQAEEQPQPAKKLSPFARFLRKLNIPLPVVLWFSAAVLVWFVVATLYLANPSR